MIKKIAIALCATVAVSSTFAASNDGFYAAHPDKSGYFVSTGIIKSTTSTFDSGFFSFGKMSDSYDFFGSISFKNENDSDTIQADQGYISGKETVISPSVGFTKNINFDQNWRFGYGINAVYTHGDINVTQSNGDYNQYSLSLLTALGRFVGDRSVFEFFVEPLNYDRTTFEDKSHSDVFEALGYIDFEYRFLF